MTEGAAAPEQPGGYLDALAVGEFRALFAAYTVSMLGDIVAAVALTVLVFQRTGSPFLAGVTFTLAFVPYLFGGALLSSLVDRVPPRRLMIGCDLLSAAIVALMALSAVPVPALLALLFLLGLISPVAAGMRNTLLVVVLPPEAFIAGRSLFRIVAQSAQVVGNAAGGLLIALTSPRGALALDCVSFLGSALVVRLATRGRAPLRGEADGAARSNVLRDSLGGHGGRARQPARPARAAARLARADLRRGARIARGAVCRAHRPRRGGGRLVAGRDPGGHDRR